MDARDPPAGALQALYLLFEHILTDLLELGSHERPEAGGGDVLPRVDDVQLGAGFLRRIHRRPGGEDRVLRAVRRQQCLLRRRV
jgi:hypothetical protein